MSDRMAKNESPREGEAEISWKPPVIAAVVGALLVSVFVIYAIVAGPVDEPESGAVQSSELPQGFTALPGGTGLKLESVTQAEGEILVGVASAVPGTADPRQTPPVEIAYWELETEAGVVVMDRQFGADTTGSTTVAFTGEMVPGEQHLVAHPATDSTLRTTSLEHTADSPGRTFEFASDAGEGVTVTGKVTVGDGWGYVDWSVEGGTTAKVDVVVTFAGEDDQSTDAIEVTRLIPAHFLDPADASGVVRAAPLFAYGGRYQLYRSGGSGDARLTPTPIVIEVTAIVATTVGEPVVVKVPADA